MNASLSPLWTLRKAHSLPPASTSPHRPQARPQTRKVLPMSLDSFVTYVPGRFIKQRGELPDEEHGRTAPDAQPPRGQDHQNCTLPGPARRSMATFPARPPDRRRTATGKQGRPTAFARRSLSFPPRLHTLENFGTLAPHEPTSAKTKPNGPAPQRPGPRREMVAKLLCHCQAGRVRCRR